ncbi:MAG: hypothetical protein ACLQPH_07520 [Acidimicrobiales bacterium]
MTDDESVGAPEMEPAIEPIYRTSTPDESVDLYEGPLRLSTVGHELEGPGSIRLLWEPYPRIAFRFDVPPEFPMGANPPLGQSGAPVDLELPAHSGRGSGQVLGQTSIMSQHEPLQRTLMGTIGGDFRRGNPTATESVHFHVANFPDYVGTPVRVGGGWDSGRLTASTADWTIDLDSISDTDLRTELNSRGGYALTHVGRIRRVNGKAVKFEDVDRLHEHLCLWLSLLRSERCAPVLFSGVHGGEVVWQTWRSPSVAPWLGTRGWLPQVLSPPLGGLAASGLGPVLQTIISSASQTELRGGLTRAVDWYTQSVEGFHLETAAIFAQAGLELMSWLCLVFDVGLSDDAFKKLDTSDALRLALDRSGIDLQVPAALAQLYSATRSSPGHPQLDGPGAVVEIRNGTIHPKALQRLGDDDVRFQGGQLAIRYLECLLLHRLGYQGAVRNRTTWQLESVPWSTQPN